MNLDVRAMNTGIFFYYQQGERLKDFPQALKGVLERDDVFLYDAFYTSKPTSSFDLEPVPIEKLYRIHSPKMVDRVQDTPQRIFGILCKM